MNEITLTIDIDSVTIAFVILTLVGILELVFSGYIFYRYRRTLTIIFFGLTALSISGWVLSNAFSGWTDPAGFWTDIMGRMAYVFASFAFHFLYLFVLSYPFPSIYFSWRVILFSLSPAIVFSALLLFSSSIVSGFETTAFAPSIYGEGFTIYALYLLLMYVLVLSEMLLKRRKLDGMHREQLGLLFWAILFSGLIGLLFNLVLPYFLDLRFTYWIGPGSSIIWLTVVWRVTQRK